MSYLSTQFAISKSMDVYEPFQQVSMWDDSFRADDEGLNSEASPILLVNTSTENRVRIQHIWLSISFGDYISFILIQNQNLLLIPNFLNVIRILQSENNPCESRGPSADDQEPNKNVNKVMKTSSLYYTSLLFIIMIGLF